MSRQQKKGGIVQEIMSKVYRKKPWNRGVTGIAAVIVFITTYLLILPAITMTKDIVCGKKEHLHLDSCYQTTYKKVLDCPFAATEGMVVLHRHDETCYAPDGTLVCTLPEVEGHVHSAECYGAEKDYFGSESVENGFGAGGFGEGSADAFTSEEGVDLFSSTTAAPLCGKAELTEHFHGQECYDASGNLICGRSEAISHQHDEDCFRFVPDQRVLICGMEEHVHDDSCYEGNEDDALDTVGDLADLFTGEASEDSDVADMPGNEATDRLDPADLFTGETADETQRTNMQDTEETDPAQVQQALSSENSAAYLFGSEPVAVVFDEDAADGLNTEVITPSETEAQTGSAVSFFISGNGEPTIAPSDIAELFGSESGEVLSFEAVGEENITVEETTEAATEYVVSDADAEVAAVEAGTEATTEWAVAEGATEATTEWPVAEGVTEAATERAAAEGVTEAATERAAAEGVTEATTERAAAEGRTEATTEWTAAENGTEAVTEQETVENKTEAVTEWEADENKTETITERETAENVTEVVTERTFAETETEETTYQVNAYAGAEITTEWISAEPSTENTTAWISAEPGTEVTTEWISAEPGTEATTEWISAESGTEATTEWISAESGTEITTEWMTSETENEAVTAWTTVEASTEITTAWVESTESTESTTEVLEYTGSNYKVRLTYIAASGIPKGAKLLAEEIDHESDKYKEYLAQAKKTLGIDEYTDLPKEYARFFDIQILVQDETGEWQEMEPAGPVRVEIIYDEAVNVEGVTPSSVNVVHFDEQEDETKVEVLATTDVESEGELNQQETNHVVDTGEDVNASSQYQVQFDGEDDISPEGYHDNIDGSEDRESDYPSPEEEISTDQAGLAVTFDAESFSVYGIIYTVDFYWGVDGEEGLEYSLLGGDSVSFRKLVEVLGIIDKDENGHIASEIDNFGETWYEEAFQKKFDQFIADVKSVEFSDESLVRVVPITEETTAGELKENLGLECEYSAELTEEQRQIMDSRVYYPYDGWALISLKAFNTEESLTVTLNTGESFIIKVTDAQISTRVLTADGETYVITLTFGPEADIPIGSEIRAREIERGSDEWYDYALKAMEAVDNVKMDAANRFFDIEIWYGYVKIEPKASVEVTIELENASVDEQNELKVVHFDDADGTVVLEAEIQVLKENSTTDIQFETASFSVYGTIAVPSNEMSGVDAEDLAGRIVRIEGSTGKYMKAQEIEPDASTHYLSHDTAADETTAWQIEGTGVPGQYYISIICDVILKDDEGNILYEEDGTTPKTELRKQYLNLRRHTGNYAHLELEDDPQVFTVTKEENGKYRFSAIAERGDGQSWKYYLFESDSGFRGTLDGTQDAKSDMTLVFAEETIGSPTEANPDSYMILTKYEGSYYIILNDGTLTKVKDPDEMVGHFKVDDPMIWYYTGDNLYHHTKETGFDGNDLASDYFYRYIDPNVEYALTDEDVNTTTGGFIQGGGVDEYVITSRPLMDQIKINYENHKINSQGNTANYVGIERGDDGQLRIVGRQTEDSAAEIYFVKVDDTTMNYSAQMQYNDKYHLVNHIDISIVGHASFTVPLAYGTYYYKDNNGEVHEMIVTRENPVELEIAQDVPVDREDVKKANITAYTYQDGEKKVLDDAFYVSGYSGNHSNNTSSNQTRIEGVFKVADMDPVKDNEWEYKDVYDLDGWENYNAEYKGYVPIESVRKERLNHRIYYTVSTTKKVTFDLTYNNHKLYSNPDDAAADNDNVLQGTATVKLAQTFDYFDKRNECPPIGWVRSSNYWNNGGIVYGWSEKTGSGMDFELGTIDKDKYGIMAIEISKYIVDTVNNAITPLHDVENKFIIYRNRDVVVDGSDATGIETENKHQRAKQEDVEKVIGMDVDEYNGGLESYTDFNKYSEVHSKTATVSDGGIGAVYDYDVGPGMIYIKEDSSEENLPQTIEDVNGKVWSYKGTRIETEYVWRDDGIQNRRHVSDVYDNRSANYNSHPEVLGEYKDSKGVDRFNGFLEYYVYNIYDAEPIDVPVKKVWEHEDGSLAQAPEGASITVTLGRYKLEQDEDFCGNLIINHTVNGWDESQGSEWRSYSATYRVKKGNRVLRTGSYDIAKDGVEITLTGMPADTYTFEIEESVNGYSADTLMNDVKRTSMPVTISHNEPVQVNIKTELSNVNKDKQVKVVVRNYQKEAWDQSTNKVPHQSLEYTFPAGKKIVLTFYRPLGGYSHTDFKAWWRTYKQGETAPNFPANPNVEWPEVENPEAYVYGYQEWLYPYTLPDEDGAIVYIDFLHAWGEGEFKIIAAEMERNTQGSSNGSSNSSSNNNSPMTSGRLMGSTNPTRELLGAGDPEPASERTPGVKTVLAANAAPKTTVPGMTYVVDEDWPGASVTLTNGHWEDVFSDLDAVDPATGFKYLYYIKQVEETGLPGEPSSWRCVLDSEEIDGVIYNQTSDGQTVLGVTNTLDNEKPKVTIKKVDENGQPLNGATFKIVKIAGGDETTIEQVEINTPDATYTIDGDDGEGLDAGSYKITEIIAPPGYVGINETIGNITFTVAGDSITSPEYPDDIVEFDGKTFTFTVKNIPENDGKLEIVKRWQDAYGNNMTEDLPASIKLKLYQLVQNDAPRRFVRVHLKFRGNGSGNSDMSDYIADPPGYTEQANTYRVAVGRGTATLTWTWNQYTSYPNTGSVKSVDVPDGCTISTPNTNTVTITIPDKGDGKDQDIDVLIDNNNYTGIDSVYSIQFANDHEESNNFTLTGGSKEITLTSPWKQEIYYLGDGLLNQNSTQLPATYNNRPCRYIIAEESVPGYSVTYSSSNNEGSGSTEYNVNKDCIAMLTAYNRKTSTDVYLVKEDSENREIKLKNARFDILRIDPSRPGPDVYYLDWTYKDPSDNTKTYVVTDNDGKATFSNLPLGYYEIIEKVAPDGYMLLSEPFYIKVSEKGVERIKRHETRRPSDWKTLDNDSMIAVNSKDTLTVGNESLSLDILKQKKDTETPLAGAEFTMKKIEGDSENKTYVEGVEPVVVTTNDDGKTTFQSIPIGYYEITETATPAGYVIADAPSFYIWVTDKVEKQNGNTTTVIEPGIYLLQKGDGKPNTWSYTATSGGSVKTFTAKTDTQNAQATIENTPGAALPSTGGEGTTLFYLLGLLMIAVGGTGILMKRKAT